MFCFAKNAKGFVLMPLNVLLTLMGKIVVMILIGFILKKTGIITDDGQKAFSKFLLKATLPASILASSGEELSGELSSGLAKTAVIAFFYYVAAIIISVFISKRLNAEDKTKKVFITMSVFANTGFLGFPLCLELYGNEGMLYAVIYNSFFQLFMFTYGIYLISSSGKFNLKELFKNPVTIASFVSIAIFLSPFRFPEFLQSALESVGGITTPLSMIIIGCTLCGMDLKELFKDKYSYLVSALRLVIFPAAMILVLSFLGLPKTVAATCAVITALPCGSLNVILAEEYDCNPEFAARTVVQSMVFMAVTVPCVIYISNLVF
jgi:hypothetical protein